MTKRTGTRSITLGDCLDAIYEWKWRILALMLLLGGGAWLVSSLIPKNYEAAVTLELVRQESAATAPALDRLLDTHAGLLRSDTVLRPVIHKLGLDADLLPTLYRLKNLNVEPVPDPPRIRLTYNHPNPETAAAVPEGIAESFLAHLAKIRSGDPSSFQNATRTQLAELETKARESANALKEFETRYPTVDLDRSHDVAAAQLYQLNTTYAEAQAERNVRETALQSTTAAPTDEVKRAYFEAGVREARAREEKLREAVEKVRDEAARASSRAVEYHVLKQRANADRLVLDEFRSRLIESESKSGLGTVSFRAVDPSGASLRAAGPNTPLNCALALMLALAAGGVAALVHVGRTNRIHTLRELSAFSGSRPLVPLPDVPQWRGLRGLAMFCEASQTPRPGDRRLPRFREQIRTLRNVLGKTPAAPPVPVIAIMSPTPGDGRSRIAVELAHAAAAAGLRTLLIDANLRTPILHTVMFTTGPRLGLATALSAEQDWRDCVLSGESGSNLDVLPSGAPDSHSLTLMRDRFSEIVNQARSVYDSVIIDTPSFVGSPESLDIARAAGAVLVVVRSRFTPARELAVMFSFLKRLGVRPGAVVLNGG